MDKVRFGIIGIGNMGTGHIATFLGTKEVNGYIPKVTNGVLTAVADLKEDRLEVARQMTNNSIHYYNCAEDLINSGDCDCVVIAIPHYDHPKYAIMALNKGLNVVSEKPAGVYTKQVRLMNETAQKSGKIFTVMFNQRTNPSFIKMHDMIANGELGDIKRVSWIITNWYRSQSYYDSGSWRATWAGEGGGVLCNQCPHNLDLLQWIVGMMPNKMRAFCHNGKWHDIEVEDDVSAYFEYPNGATGTFITSTADAPGTNRFEITGTRGKLVYDIETKPHLIFHKLDVDEREFNRTNKEGFKRPDCKVIPIEIPADVKFPAHAGVFDNVANAILGIEEQKFMGIDGIKTVELANAMELSSWLDQTVSMPVDEDLYLEELNKRIATSKLKTNVTHTTFGLDKTF